MARKGRRKRQRRPQQLAKAVVVRKISKGKGYALRPDLREVEDMRTWHPQRDDRTFKRLDGTEATYVTQTEDKNKFRKIGQTYFSDPRKVTICKRRKERRESLFAGRKVGKGKGSTKKRRRTYKSNIRCS